MNSDLHERLERRKVELEEKIRSDLPNGFVVERRVHFDSNDERYKIKDTEKRVVGVLYVVERAFDSDRDLFADLKRQKYLEELRKHDRCRLNEKGVLKPHTPPK